MSSELGQRQDRVDLLDEQARLLALLDSDDNWKALRQLDNRLARGEGMSAIPEQELRASILRDLADNPAHCTYLAVCERLSASAAQKPPVEPSSDSIEVRKTPAGVPVAAGVLASISAASAHTTAGPSGLDPGADTFRTRVKVKAKSMLEVQPAAPAIAGGAALPIETPTPRATAVEIDDLLRIRGITREISDKLGAQGITGYAQIAGWRRQDVVRISAALGLGRTISRNGWIEQAALLAMRRSSVAKTLVDPPPQPLASVADLPTLPLPPPAPLPQPVANPLAGRSDLIRGPRAEERARLVADGVVDVQQIARWTYNDVEHWRHTLDCGRRISREGWIEQAKVLAGGRLTAHAELVLSGRVLPPLSPRPRRTNWPLRPPLRVKLASDLARQIREIAECDAAAQKAADLPPSAPLVPEQAVALKVEAPAIVKSAQPEPVPPAVETLTLVAAPAPIPSPARPERIGIRLDLSADQTLMKQLSGSKADSGAAAAALSSRPGRTAAAVAQQVVVAPPAEKPEDAVAVTAKAATGAPLAVAAAKPREQLTAEQKPREHTFDPVAIVARELSALALPPIEVEDATRRAASHSLAAVAANDVGAFGDSTVWPPAAGRGDETDDIWLDADGSEADVVIIPRDTSGGHAAHRVPDRDRMERNLNQAIRGDDFEASTYAGYLTAVEEASVEIVRHANPPPPPRGHPSANPAAKPGEVATIPGESPRAGKVRRFLKALGGE